MSKKIILISLLKIILVQIALSCGMVTHDEISKRAFNYFKPTSKRGIDYKQLITNDSKFLTGGSQFPDWGYDCSNRDAAEYAHWPPFIHSYITLMNKKYSHDKTRYAQLVSFLFGIVSHDFADIVWHWGKKTTGTAEQGFLHSMGHMASECNDDWENCHRFGDEGVDLYLSYRRDNQSLNRYWAFPIDFLQELYETNKLPSDKLTMESCMVMFYIGFSLEQLAAITELSKNEKPAAFLSDDIDLWFHGGIDDMAAHVSWQWQNIINMIENENESNEKNLKLKKNSDNFNRNRNVKPYFRNLEIKNAINLENYKEIANLLGLITEKNKYGDIILSINKATYDKNEAQIIGLVSSALKNGNQSNNSNESESELKFISSKAKSIEPKKMLSSNIEFSYFGKSVTYGDFNGDGVEELVIGAPGYGDMQTGCVYIKTQSESEINYNDPFLIGDNLYSRFGYSVITADINHDGIDDLIVSAPSYGKNGPGTTIDEEGWYPKDYIGRIYIYYGNKSTGIVKNSQPDHIITTKYTDEMFFNLGYFLAAEDCDGDGYKDLLIGSPYSQQEGDKRGYAAVFTSLIKNNGNKISFIEDAQFTMVGCADYQELGYHMTCKKNTVYIGVPGFRYKKRDFQSSGAVHAVDIKSKQVLYTIYSDKPQARFGAYFDLHDNLLAVSAPTYNLENLFKYHQGVVFIYDIDKIKSDIYINDYKVMIKSNITRSRFGRTLKFYKDNLIVSSPMFSSSSVVIENGKVFIFKINKLINSYKDKEILELHDADYEINHSINGARFGDEIAISNGEIAISAPYSRDMAGEVILLDI